MSLAFWLLGFFCWPCRNTTRAPRSSCVVQEIVEAGAKTGGKSRETRGGAAGNGPPRGIVGRVFLLGVDSTTMPLTAHDNNNSHTITHIEARRGEAVHAAPAAHADPGYPVLTPIRQTDVSQGRCMTRALRSPCVVQEIVAAEEATGRRLRGARGKAAGNAPPSRGIGGRVSLLGDDSTTMPLVAHENRNSHTLIHIEATKARRGRACRLCSPCRP